MKRSLVARSVLASVVVVLGLLWFAGAQNAPGVPPTLSVPERILAGGMLSGFASRGGDTVVVEATVDGQPLPGSPDVVMEGDQNHFAFPTGEEMRGKTVVVTARCNDGSTTTRHVRID